MAKDFDQARRERAERDRDFILAGQTFTVRKSVRPETLAAYEAISEDTPVADVLAIVDGVVVGMIEPNDDAAARYRAIRESDEDALSLEDLEELVKWLIETQTGRPTLQPAGFSPGPAGTGTNSTDASSSPVSGTA